MCFPLIFKTRFRKFLKFPKSILALFYVGIKMMLKTQTYPSSNPVKLLDDRAILYQKSAKNIQLTIVEGTHEMLNKVVLENLE